MNRKHVYSWQGQAKKGKAKKDQAHSIECEL